MSDVQTGGNEKKRKRIFAAFADNTKEIAVNLRKQHKTPAVPENMFTKLQRRVFMKNFVKWFGIIAFIMFIGFFSTACKKDSLDGTTWKASDYGEEFVLEFKNPNFTLMVDERTVLEGSYVISGNTVTMVMKDDDLSFTGPLVGNTLLLSDSEGDGTIRFMKQ